MHTRFEGDLDWCSKSIDLYHYSREPFSLDKISVYCRIRESPQGLSANREGHRPVVEQLRCVPALLKVDKVRKSE